VVAIARDGVLVWLACGGEGEPLGIEGLGIASEGHNLAGLVALAWHQSRAFTLATLSSRVCSLSVRVLILMVGVKLLLLAGTPGCG